MKSTNELKFLLKLLSYPDYRAPLTQLSTIKGRNQICQELGARGWIDYSREVATAVLLPAGRSLLEVDPASLPIEAIDWKLLQKLALTTNKVLLSELSISKFTKANLQAALVRLGDRGFVKLEWQIQRQKGEVWLTSAGLEYLRDDYVPDVGKNPTLSLDMLRAYIQFLRKHRQAQPNPDAATTPSAEQPASDLNPTQPDAAPPSDAEILHLIQRLDADLNTENYLPLFHLRQALPMQRQALDEALYRLQKADHLELSSLQETDAYTPEQIRAGIPQLVGGPLFFITLN
jgi:hypothetical protein